MHRRNDHDVADPVRREIEAPAGVRARQRHVYAVDRAEPGKHVGGIDVCGQVNGCE